MTSDLDLVQIVDEKDEPVGEASLKQMHDQDLIHRVVRIMIEDDEGRILLQKRSSNKKRYPNCWDNSASGHVDVGESYEAAAKRELAEELGVADLKLEEMGYYYSEATRYKSRKFNKIYRVRTNLTPKKLQSTEVVEVRWFNLEQIKKLILEHPDQMSDGLPDVISRYYK